MENSYDMDWFKSRAISSLKKIGNNTWDYSDSLLLYLPGGEEAYEEAQETENPYYSIVTTPEKAYLQKISTDILNELGKDFEYIDLGPGTEHKEQYIFDEAKIQNKTFKYCPVDISDRYLKLSNNHAEKQGVKTRPIRASFEELSKILDSKSKNRFVSIGLTYTNYNPREILELLKEIAGDGKIFINAQIRERVDTEALKTIYSQAAIGMISPKIQLLGLGPINDSSSVEVTDEVKIWYTVKDLNPILESHGVAVGDKLLIFQSLRPTLDNLRADISKEFEKYQLLDTGDLFVGAILN